MANHRTTATMGTSASERAGVRVQFAPNRSRSRQVAIWGWYDSYAGIEGHEYSLRELLTGLGITLADCRRALEGEDG
jgi:hypothetical protein